MRKTIRKTLMGLLVLVSIVSMLAGCGDSSTQTNAPTPTPSAETPTPSPDSSPSQSSTPTPTPPPPSPEPSYDPAEDPDQGRFFGGSFTNTVGGLVIETEWIPLEVSLPRAERSNISIAVIGDAWYLLVDGVLRQYKPAGGVLVLEKEYPPLEVRSERGMHDTMSVDRNGVLYVSGSGCHLYAFKDGEEIMNQPSGVYTPAEYISAPSGEWGIAATNYRKAIMDGSWGSLVEWPRVEGSRFSAFVSITEKYVFIGARAEDITLQSVHVFDHNENYLMTLSDDPNAERETGRLGTPSGAVDTGNGFMVADSNFNNLIFYDRNGAVIGVLNSSDLFGTQGRALISIRQPALLPDGSMVFAFLAERTDGDGEEVIVYRLTGF